NGVEGTRLRFTQADSDDDNNGSDYVDDDEGRHEDEDGGEEDDGEGDDIPTLSQSQRVMTFITQEPLSQLSEIVGTQGSAGASQVDHSPVQLSQTRTRPSRRSSIGLAPSQPLSPMTLDLFASVQEGTEWYTQPLTQTLLSTLEE